MRIVRWSSSTHLANQHVINCSLSQVNVQANSYDCLPLNAPCSTATATDGCLYNYSSPSRRNTYSDYCYAMTALTVLWPSPSLSLHLHYSHLAVTLYGLVRTASAQQVVAVHTQRQVSINTCRGCAVVVYSASPLEVIPAAVGRIGRGSHLYIVVTTGATCSNVGKSS